MDIALHTNWIMKEQMLKFKTKLKLYEIKKKTGAFLVTAQQLELL